MRTKALLGLAALAMACGGAGSERNSGSGGIMSAGDDGSGDGSGGDGGQEGADDGATGAADGTAGADNADEGGAGALPKFDVGTNLDIEAEGGCGMGGDLEFSYIWIANSTQDTVSKIHTQTLMEEGRYQTRPAAGGSPSRTSVSLGGDVAVANRMGGLTKFYADPANCTDLNGNGVIDTSNGPGNVLPWDNEECRAWHVPFNYTSQRPVQWTAGTYNPATCQYEDAKVWTTGVINNATLEVNLLNGDTGAIEDSVQIPEINPGYYGFYGGAVDADGNLWVAMLGGPSIARIMFNDLSYDIWPQQHGGYGMTVGASGYVFTCTNVVGRFDPAVEMWTGSVNTPGGSGGCMEDANGILWTANNYGAAPIVGVDVQTMQVVAQHQLPEHVHGISIDFEGYVWGVSMSSNAFRVDPATGLYDTVTGLVGPYTYSDMTGFALNSVGGGPPTG